MRVVTALDVRKRFGQIIDEAAAGERIVIERAGQPVAAIVPLSDLEYTEPERQKAARLAALDEIRAAVEAERISGTPAPPLRISRQHFESALAEVRRQLGARAAPPAPTGRVLIPKRANRAMG